MTTHIEEGADAVFILTDDDDLFGPDFEEEVIPFLGDARHMARDDPFLADHLIEVGLEHRVTRVKLLIKTIADACVGSETMHQLVLGFRHQILIRAFVGSYIGLSEAVAG